MRTAPIVIAALAALLGACGSSPSPAPSSEQSQQPIRIDPRRIDVVTGAGVVVPLDAVPVREIATALTVRLDDGRSLPSRLCRVGVSVLRPGPTETIISNWLPRPGVWTALDALPGNAQTVGGTAVVAIEIPVDAVGQAIWIGGVRHTVNWLPAIASLVRTDAGDGPWSPVAPDAPQTLLDAARSEADTPLGRWRYRLLVDGLNPDKANHAGDDTLAPFPDPVIETLARQNEDRWRVALAWLWSANPELCQRLKRRLASFVDFGDGHLAPAWPTDHASLDRLLSDLLDATLTPDRRAQRAEDWLDGQPKGTAWIIDEGGTPSEGEARLVSVGVANFVERETLCWVQAPGTPNPELFPLKPFTATQLLALLPRQADALEARAGGYAVRLGVVPGSLAAVPPGVACGPLLEDLAMRSWLAGEVTLPKIEWSTSAMLHRPPARSDTGAPASWELFCECRLVPGVGLLEHESVRVYLGPRDAPTRIFRVTLAGEVFQELPASEDQTPVDRVSVARQSGGWSFRLPIPSFTIEPDATLRLALTRTDALGRRSAWPRAMLPWQTDPARARIDTSTWGVPSPVPTTR